MPTPRRYPRSPQWPFWLLLAAWVCANTPQTAAYVVLTWLSEARSFAHHERLTRDVAFLLNGENAPGILAAVSKLPREEPKPPLVAQGALKKMDLTVEQTCEVMPPHVRDNERFPSAPEPQGVGRAAPPTQPPRLA